MGIKYLYTVLSPYNFYLIISCVNYTNIYNGKCKNYNDMMIVENHAD